MAKGNDYGCVTRQVIRQRCAPEEVEPGKRVYRCEKTVQTLRDCVGRPAEVIDSQTEITEHEIDGRWNHGLDISVEQSSSSSSGNWDRDVMQELDNVIEGVERMTEGIMGRVERITEEAGRITGSLFGFPSFPGEEREDIMGGAELITEAAERIMEEAERITGSLFGYPSFPGEEREDRSRHVFSFPVNEEEREEDKRDEYEMQEPSYSDFADKIKDV